MGKKDHIKQYGHLIMGLGLIFFGMGIMSEGMTPLRSYEPFIALMQNVSNPVIGILVATLFTALVQSSSATMGVVIAMALQGLISLEAGIALALGANIGTCATAGLAAIGKPREAVRVAVAHVTFKIVGVILIFPFIPYLADLVRDISPAAAAGLVGMDKLAAETPRQIANAHTIFNVGLATVFLPFAGLFARFCEWIVPDRTLDRGAGPGAPHLPGRGAARHSLPGPGSGATGDRTHGRVRQPDAHQEHAGLPGRGPGAGQGDLRDRRQGGHPLLRDRRLSGQGQQQCS